MSKALSEMSLEELWELFPISLVAHNDQWASYYSEMESFLKGVLAAYRIVRISHIGSTAIDGIWAKNIVDILLEIGPDENMEKVADVVEKHGFTRMSTKPASISLNYGYTQEGFAEKVYHLHIRFEGDNNELYFRDYLNEYPQIAKAYEQLKLDLWRKFEHNISKLPEKQRRRLTLYYFGEFTYEQIAEMEGCAFQVVAKSIKAAERNLKKLLIGG